MGETLENYLFLLFFGVIVILQAEICKFCSNSQIAGSNLEWMFA